MVISYKTSPIKIGKVIKGPNSYCIVADGHSIFGFGKTLGDAHVHWLKACYAFMRHAGTPNPAKSEQEPLEEQLLIG